MGVRHSSPFPIVRFVGIAALVTFGASVAPLTGRAGTPVPVQPIAALRMSWDNCFGDGPVVTAKSFACDANTGSQTLVCSLVNPTALGPTKARELIILVVSQSAPLPSWWNFVPDISTPVPCRSGSLRADFTYHGSGAGCVAAWPTDSLLGGIVAYPGFNGPVPGIPQAQMATFDVVAAVPDDQAAPLAAGVEYFLANVTIDDANTIGTGSCGGCSEAVCLTLISATLSLAPGPAAVAFQTDGVQTTVHWQGTGADCLVVPVRRTSWGAIKTLYR